MPTRLIRKLEHLSPVALSVMWLAGAIGFAILTLLVVHQVRNTHQLAEQNRDRLTQERRIRKAAVEQAKRQAAETKLASYILCRSVGRSPMACRKIIRGIALPPRLTLKALEAKIATLGEIRVTRIFVKGQAQHVPEAIRGAQGPPGARGTQGAQGPQGPPGARGSRGHNGVNGLNGAAGARGAQGPPGPPGAPGAVCKWQEIRIPGTGTFTVCTQ